MWISEAILLLQLEYDCIVLLVIQGALASLQPFQNQKVIDVWMTMTYYAEVF